MSTSVLQFLQLALFPLYTCVLVDIPERESPRGTQRRLVLGAPQLLPAGGLALGAPLRSRAARVPRANARPRLAH